MKVLLGWLALMALALGVVGCGSGSAGRATAEDKANIERLAKEGIGPGKAPEGAPGAPGAQGNAEGTPGVTP